jgi:hypothetical protein
MPACLFFQEAGRMAICQDTSHGPVSVGTTLETLTAADGHGPWSERDRRCLGDRVSYAPACHPLSHLSSVRRAACIRVWLVQVCSESLLGGHLLRFHCWCACLVVSPWCWCIGVCLGCGGSGGLLALSCMSCCGGCPHQHEHFDLHSELLNFALCCSFLLC